MYFEPLKKFEPHLYCLLILSALFLAGCQPAGEGLVEPTPTLLPEATAVPTTPPLNMANQAAVYCEEQGYTTPTIPLYLHHL